MILKMQSITKITIPEMEQFNHSNMNAIKAFLLLFGHELQQLKTKYPVNNIDNLYGYKTFLLEKLLHNIHTYVIVVEECHDYVIALSILRTLIDNIAVYILIYRANTEEEVLLRHYLYIMDGIEQELRIHSKHPLRYTNNITKEEYEMLYKNLTNKIENLNISKQFCIKAIKKLSIYATYYKSIDRLIEKCNWKYKLLDKPTDKYSWAELHDILPSKHKCLYSDLCNHISQQVHGLSMSNLIIDTDNQDLYEPFSANVILILNFIHEFISHDFNADEAFLRDGFSSEELRACLSFYKNINFTI